MNVFTYKEYDVLLVQNWIYYLYKIQLEYTYVYKENNVYV